MATVKRNALINKRLHALKREDEKNGCFDTISFEELLALFDSQDWKCYFCGEEFIFEKSNKRTFSIDRIDNKFGHIVGNVRIIHLRFQTYPTWTKEFYNNVFHNHEAFKDELLAIKASIVDYDNAFNQWVKNMRRSAYTRNHDDFQKFFQTPIPDLTSEVIREIYEEQGGICFYSGLPIVVSRDKLYSGSIERKKTCLPYIRSNICLVMRAFNCPDRSNTYWKNGVLWELDDPVLLKHVAQGWSVEDVEELRSRRV